MAKANIVILGNKGFGKTCTLSSIYKILSTTSVAGYQLQIRNFFSPAGHKQRKKLNDFGDGIAKEGKLPDASDKKQLFNFSLSYACEPVMDIDWLDYPGGWLDDMTLDEGGEENGEEDDEELFDEDKEEPEDQLEKNRADAREFFNYLFAADVLIFCIPAGELIRKPIGDNEYLQTYYEVLKQIKTNALRRVDGDKKRVRLTPVIFLITKADQCDTPQKAEKLTENLALMIERSPCMADEDWLIFACECTLGKGLKFVNEAHTEIDTDTYNPQGYDVPIFLSAACTLRFQRQDIEHKIKEIAQEADRHQNTIKEKQAKLRYQFGIGKKAVYSASEAIQHLTEEVKKLDEEDEKNKAHLKKIVELLESNQSTRPLAYKNGSSVSLRNVL